MAQTGRGIENLDIKKTVKLLNDVILTMIVQFFQFSIHINFRLINDG